MCGWGQGKGEREGSTHAMVCACLLTRWFHRGRTQPQLWTGLCSTAPGPVCFMCLNMPLAIVTCQRCQWSGLERFGTLCWTCGTERHVAVPIGVFLLPCREMRSLLRRYPDFPDMRAALAAAQWAAGREGDAETNWQRVEDIRCVSLFRTSCQPRPLASSFSCRPSG